MYACMHEVIWFVQNRKVGCLNLNVIKNRKYKISDVLIHNGYKVQNSEEFDEAFRKIVKEVI